MKIGSLLPTLALAAGVMLIIAQPGICQKATVAADAKSGKAQLEAMTSRELKEAIRSAAVRGDLAMQDAKDLLAKITDVETLMDQFDFIRDQEKTMIGSMGSLYR